MNEVIPKVGVGEIRFGMSPAEVVEIMGEPYSPKEMLNEWPDPALSGIAYQGVLFDFDKADGSGPLADAKVKEIWLNEQTTYVWANKPLSKMELETMISILEKSGSEFYVRGLGITSRELNYEMEFSPETKEFEFLLLLP